MDDIILPSSYKLSSIPELKHFLNLELSDIFFLNIRSIRANFAELIDLFDLLNHRFTLIVLNEAWIGPGEESMFNIDGYTCFSMPRNRHGGGIIIYCKDNLNPTMIDKVSMVCDCFESLFISLKINGISLTVGSVYRPPSQPLNLFLNVFKLHVLNKISLTNTLICGDFNIDVSDTANGHIVDFVSEMSSLGFNNLITDPTRVTQHSSTIIDHIWTSFTDTESAFVLEYPITDHHAIGCQLNIPTENDFKMVKSRNVDPRKYKTFKNEFIDFMFSIGPTDANSGFKNLFDHLSKSIANNFPAYNKKVTYKTMRAPWIDNDLKKLISKKHKMFGKYKLGLLNFNRYRKYRNTLNATLNLAQKLYFRKQFKDAYLDQKFTWKIINRLSNPCK